MTHLNSKLRYFYLTFHGGAMMQGAVQKAYLLSKQQLNTAGFAFLYEIF